ncbi:MAG: DNA mismatch repair endonuclease MutL [Phycisphaerae bacterium]|nr:DNA mismatch repair endonuclease MutL [Phycisphaerae bacterium]
MPQINVLPDLLVNKIAAGEVIERPASVIKELVENSLDAGAKRIEVAVEQGGAKLIRIVDDGEGMDAEDLARCILPHATSKLRTEDDLFAIRTMGFRGEALASVGAVAQLRIVSRQAASDAAHEIRVAGDRIEPVTLAAGPPGTTVEVRELFFNVPARQKFLRTAQTEMGHVTEQVARIALAHTAIEFRLTHNGREVYHLRPASDMRSRIADLYGADLANTLLAFDRDERGLKITGYAGLPADARSSAKWQYIFLNGRYIRDRFVSHAVREAYRGLMEPSRYPVFFVRMEVDPAGVDVNVHPTKSEVRWRDSNVVYSQVLSSLRDRFLSADLTPAYRPGPAAFASGSGGGGTTDGEPDTEAEALRRQRIRESMADFFKRQSPGSPATSPEARPPWPTSGPRPDRPPGAGQFTMPADPGLWPPPGGYTQPASPPLSHEWADVHGVEGTLPAYRNTIQVHDAFLVAETDDGLTIIDQHALHERVLYEQFSRQIARGPLESQRLLLSETVDVTPDEVALLDTHGELFGQLGFELSAYGPSTIAVHATPSLLKPDRVSEFLRDAFGRLADRDAPASAELLLDALISMMACKAAVKAGDPLSSQEIEALMAKRDLVERSSNCPHGRPTSLNLSLADLEKQFKRT